MTTTPFTHTEAPAIPQTIPVESMAPAFSTPATDQPGTRTGVDPQVIFSQPAEQTPQTAPVAFDPAPGFKEPR